jgi:hypothetical protein
MAKDNPPVENSGSRFGNPAFRAFYDKVAEVKYFINVSSYILNLFCKSSSSLHATLPRLPPDAIQEVEVYFRESWGNRSRIDYGSGMELNFLCWLCVLLPFIVSPHLMSGFRKCLECLGVFQESDHTSIVIKVFWKYVHSLDTSSRFVDVGLVDTCKLCVSFSQRSGLNRRARMAFGVWTTITSFPSCLVRRSCVVCLLDILISCPHLV